MSNQNKKMIFETQSFVVKDAKGNKSIHETNGGAYLVDDICTPYSKEVKITKIELKKNEQQSK